MPEPTYHGEIWWAMLDKRRPVVVASRDDRQGAREQATVALVTTTVRGIPSEVAVDRGDGFPRASVINCDDLATVHKAVLQERIGRLSQRQLEELHQALRFSLAIP